MADGPEKLRPVIGYTVPAVFFKLCYNYSCTKSGSRFDAGLMTLTSQEDQAVD